MTLLVTGATGFLGGRLVRRALAMGRSVTAVGRDPAKLLSLRAQGATVLEWDLSRPIPLGYTAIQERPSTIVHCAAHSAPSGHQARFVAANIRSAENLADLAVALEVRHFIQISTSAVYFSPRDQLGLTEEVPLPPPINAYAASKAEAERIVLARLGDRATVLRPRGIYGAGDTALLPRLLRAAASGPLPLLRQGRAFTDLTHVEDVVDAILAAEPRPPGAPRLYNVSGGEALNIRDVVEAACGRMGIVPRWRTVPVPLAMAAAGLLEAAGRLKGSRAEPRITRYSLGILAYSQTLDLGLARRVLGWAPRIPFAEGLEEALGGLEVRALQHGAGE